MLWRSARRRQRLKNAVAAGNSNRPTTKKKEPGKRDILTAMKEDMKKLTGSNINDLLTWENLKAIGADSDSHRHSANVRNHSGEREHSNEKVSTDQCRE